MDNGERELPNASDAEVAVLAAMSIETSAVVEATEILSPSMFYFDRNRRLYGAMVSLWEQGSAIDPVTVADRLRATGDYDAAGGIDYIASLIGYLPTAEHVRYHATIVRDHYRLRSLIEASARTIREATDTGDRTVDEIVSAAETRLLSIETRGTSDYHRAKDRLWGVFENIERAAEAGAPKRGIQTGLPDLDKMTLGLQPGELTVVAARPSMGKTSLALSWALHATIDQGAPTLVFSFEMTSDELILRALSSEARVDLHKLRSGAKLSTEENARLATAAAHLNTAPLFLDDSGDDHVAAVTAKARRAVKAEGIGLVVVDYLQLLEADGDGRRERIDAISRGFKRLAHSLQIPVVLLSQLSRGPENRTSKRPILSDLRESGGIEQDADNVVLLFRPDYYLSDEELAKSKTAKPGLTDLIIAKHRNGPTGTVRVWFRKETTRFDSVDRTENFHSNGATE